MQRIGQGAIRAVVVYGGQNIPRGSGGPSNENTSPGPWRGMQTVEVNDHFPQRITRGMDGMDSRPHEQGGVDSKMKRDAIDFEKILSQVVESSENPTPCANGGFGVFLYGDNAKKEALEQLEGKIKDLEVSHKDVYQKLKNAPSNVLNLWHNSDKMMESGSELYDKINGGRLLHEGKVALSDEQLKKIKDGFIRDGSVIATTALSTMADGVLKTTLEMTGLSWVIGGLSASYQAGKAVHVAGNITDDDINKIINVIVEKASQELQDGLVSGATNQAVATAVTFFPVIGPAAGAAVRVAGVAEKISDVNQVADNIKGLEERSEFFKAIGEVLCEISKHYDAANHSSDA